MHELKTSFRTMLVIGVALGFIFGGFSSVIGLKAGYDGSQWWAWINNNDGYVTTSGGKGYPPTTAGLQSAVNQGGIIYGNNATITLTTFITISKSNTEVRDLHLLGSDGLKIYAGVGLILSNVTLKNIDLHITSGALESAIVVYVEGTATARNILLENCFVNDCYNGGIYFDGPYPSKLVNATIRNCKAYHSGHIGYTDGMFLGTWDNTNVLYENCLAVENWDLGFSNEMDHLNNNVKYLSCGAIKNGLKRTFAGNGTNCTGFLMGHGVDVVDCYSDSNYNYGFLFGSDTYNMNVSTMTNCRDNHSRVGLYVARAFDNPEGSVIINGFTSMNSTDEAIRITGAHITAKGLVVINPGYNHTYGGSTTNGIRGAVLLGGVLDRIEDSEIEVSLYNLTKNAGTDYVFGGLYGVYATEPFRCTISANVKGAFLYPIYTLSPTDTVFKDCYVDSHCRAGLRTAGTVTATYLKDSFFCDNYGGAISTAGVWGNGTVGNLKVETGSVTVMDAVTPFLGCNAVTSAGPFIWNSKGNGFNVSQSGLQQAIWDLNSSGGGWVDGGNNNISYSVTTYITSDVELRRIKMWENDNANVSAFRNEGSRYTPNRNDYNIKLTDIILEGNGLNQPEWWIGIAHHLYPHAIYFRDVYDSTIQNVVINNTQFGGIFIERGTNNIITDCKLYNIGKLFIDSGSALGAYGIVAIWLYNGSTSLISNCIIDNSYSGGIIIESHNVAPVNYWNKNIIISNCIVSNTNYAYYFEDAKDCMVTDCVSYGSIITGGHPGASASVYLDGRTKNITIDGLKSYKSKNAISNGGKNNIFNGVESYISSSTAFSDSGKNTTYYKCISYDSALRGFDISGTKSTVIHCVVKRSATNGITFDGTASVKANNPYGMISYNIVDSSLSYGIYVTMSNISIENNIINNSANIGIFVSGAKYVKVNSNVVRFGGSSAIDLTSCNKGIVSNNFVNGGNIWSYGIALQSSKRLNVYGNTIEQSASNTPAYGITETGTSNYNFIYLNYINITVGTGKITKLGANTIVRDNFGYVTENWGLARIAAGGTSIVVNHNLSATPTYKFCNPDGNITYSVAVDSQYWWIDTVTSTQFTIHLHYATVASVVFDWYAKV